jgi:hypothetical protein
VTGLHGQQCSPPGGYGAPSLPDHRPTR